ncbi:hypothetical protein [Corynebacterium parakroppenstedtii]|nr:hypothetical protein [Corynebacterium parakroppenstedtii]MBY0795178.1 hypothetical protein [Corynebacterium parakroppenstedtii]
MSAPAVPQQTSWTGIPESDGGGPSDRRPDVGSGISSSALSGRMWRRSLE